MRPTRSAVLGVLLGVACSPRVTEPAGSGDASQTGSNAGSTGVASSTSLDDSGTEGRVAFEPCWIWRPDDRETSLVKSVRGMDSGGAVAVGARGEAPTAFVTALSAAGTEEWTATPMGSGSYHHVELLPTGTIVAVGWAGGDADNPSVVDAYSPDGDPLWRWDAPPDRRYWRVAWWPGGERILVGSGDGSGASGLLTLDSDGSLDRTFDTSMLGGVSAIAALGTGFAICGTASQGGQWAVGAFDAQGSLMWTLEGEEAGEHRCTDLESDGESRLLSWIDSQGPGPGYFDSWSVSAVSIDAGAVEWTYRVGLDGPTVGAIALGDDGTGYFAIAGLDATTVTVKPRSPGQWGTTSLGDLGSLLEEAVYRNGRLFLAGNSSFPLQGYTGCWNIVQG